MVDKVTKADYFEELYEGLHTCNMALNSMRGMKVTGIERLRRIQHEYEVLADFVWAENEIEDML